MIFRMVPKSVTLNDLQWHNGIISANSSSFRGALRKSSRSLSDEFLYNYRVACICWLPCFLSIYRHHVAVFRPDNSALSFLQQYDHCLPDCCFNHFLSECRVISDYEEL